MHTTTVAFDLVKSVFQLAVTDANWRVIEQHRLSRRQFEKWFVNRSVSLVVMEACGSAHHWARWLNSLGIAVKLLPAAYIRAYVKRNKTVSAAIHRQALRALLFLYKQVLRAELPWMGDLHQPVKPARRPTVLIHEEVDEVLRQMHGIHALMARLMYGTGMRLMECLALQVKDVDFNRREIIIRDGKGGKDRATMLPLVLNALPRQAWHEFRSPLNMPHRGSG